MLAAAAAESRGRVTRPAPPGDLVALELAALAAEPPALRALVLHEIIREAMGGDALVERRLVEAVQRLATRTDDAGRVSLGRGLEAVRGAGLLRIRAAAPAHACAPASGRRRRPRRRRRLGGVGVTFCGRAWRLRLLPGAAFDRRAALAGEAFAGLDGPPRRVTLRHPRRGERFAPLGLGRETTVARYLAAARVPADLRPLVPVLDVDARAAWVGHAAAGLAAGLAPAPGRVAHGYRVAHSSVLTLHVIREGT